MDFNIHNYHIQKQDLLVTLSRKSIVLADTQWKYTPIGGEDKKSNIVHVGFEVVISSRREVIFSTSLSWKILRLDSMPVKDVEVGNLLYFVSVEACVQTSSLLKKHYGLNAITPPSLNEVLSIISELRHGWN